MRKVFKRLWRMRGKYLYKHIRRIPGQYLILYGERSEFRVVFDTKNRLQIRI
jgi:hypothetical protein